MNVFEPSSYREVRVTHTDVPGLLVIGMEVRPEGRGWFKENFKREKFESLGFPAGFEIVQNNISYHAQRGATRGIHAKPYDQFITIASGSVFAAIVDLRAGDGFGKTASFELNPGISLFIPRACGQAFQSLESDTAYSSMMNGYDSPDTPTTSINLWDAELNVQWPIPLEWAEVAESDKSHPNLKDIQPIQS
ncbi:MAG TPA: dTDP-4-dehydrorhamnose 3,5-epimerase family protein [Candidatus Saccharimonadales bacterium]|nr:dTDP-4-dehydrorhamnose 3,5-epimerase family protein [Candidatus Saccharimonadales bacterium]